MLVVEPFEKLDLREEGSAAKDFWAARTEDCYICSLCQLHVCKHHYQDSHKSDPVLGMRSRNQIDIVIDCSLLIVMQIVLQSWE